MKLSDIAGAVGILAVGLVLLFLTYTVFAWVPYSLYTESRCAALGYPKHKVTVGLEGYCMTLDGVVQVPVKPLKEIDK